MPALATNKPIVLSIQSGYSVIGLINRPVQTEIPTTTLEPTTTEIPTTTAAPTTTVVVTGPLLDGFSILGTGTQTDPLRYGGTPQTYAFQSPNYVITGTVNPYVLNWDQPGGVWIDGVTISSVNGTATNINRYANRLRIGGTAIGVTQITKDPIAPSITGFTFLADGEVSNFKLTTDIARTPPVTGIRLDNSASA